MTHFVTLLKTAVGRLFVGFLHSRTIAEFPLTDDFIWQSREDAKDTSRVGGGLTSVAVL